MNGESNGLLLKKAYTLGNTAITQQHVEQMQNAAAAQMRGGGGVLLRIVRQGRS